MRGITEEQKKLIKKMLKSKKYKHRDIAIEAGVSDSTVTRYAAIFLEAERKRKAKKEAEEVRRFLREHWHWTGDLVPRDERPKKYRTVHRGEKGHLRTPTRTDGRFQ